MDKIQWLTPLPTDQASYRGWMLVQTVKYGWDYNTLQDYLFERTMAITGKDFLASNVSDIFPLLKNNQIPCPNHEDMLPK
jgi:hypothetical protein